jgi:hypothetical protein
MEFIRRSFGGRIYLLPQKGTKRNKNLATEEKENTEGFNHEGKKETPAATGASTARRN